MKPLIKHTILPFDYPTTYNEWILLLEMEQDKTFGTDKALQVISQEADCLIDQVNEILTFNR